MRTRVLQEYRSAYPNPITFEKGDRVHLGAVDNDYPGWVRVTTECGNEGWAPLRYLERFDTTVAVATTTYSAQELTAKPGELVEVLKQVDGWVWCINIRGQCGWLPRAVLEIA